MLLPSRSPVTIADLITTRIEPPIRPDRLNLSFKPRRDLLINLCGSGPKMYRHSRVQSGFPILIYGDAGLISFQLPTASGLLPAGRPFEVQWTQTELVWKFDIRFAYKALGVKASGRCHPVLQAWEAGP